MSNVAISRKQRFQTLESEIPEDYGASVEAAVRVGSKLKEIRDDELYKEGGFESWDQYLRRRVAEEFGIERSQAFKLIACAQIRAKLPGPPLSTAVDNGAAAPEWSQKALYEFGRLAPKSEDARGKPYDLDRLNKRDVERVAKKVIDHCQETGDKPTAPVVRKFVDEDLGVNRAAQAAETRRKREQAEREAEQAREEEAHPVLDQWLNDLIR
jgi:hypothetical protein